MRTEVAEEGSSLSCADDADYPAAHSADVSWYAVDSAGYVALFQSGENGPAPRAAEGEYYLTDLVRTLVPEIPSDALPPYEELAERFGIFLYDYDEPSDLVGAYHRRVVPPRPAHVDELPPEIRRGCKEYRLP